MNELIALTRQTVEAMRFKRHWYVDFDGVAGCGTTCAVPARLITDVDCKRCIADGEFQAALSAELARRARTAESRSLYPHITFYDNHR